MTESINQELRDLLLKRQHFIQRFENGTIQMMVEPYRRAKGELTAKMNKIIESGTGHTKQFRITRLRSQIGDLDVVLRNARSDAISNLTSELTNFAHSERDYYQNILDVRAGNIGINIARLPIEKIDEIVGTPIGGATYAEKMVRRYGEHRNLIKDQLTQSIIQGEDTRRATARIRGLVGGSLASTEVGKRIINQANVIARTEIIRVSNDVNVQVFERNRDVVKSVEFVATLDNRTCIACAGLDGQVWDYDKGQRPSGDEFPPVHPMCRCFVDFQAQIYTSKGNKNIGDIKVGDLVLTHKGQFKKVTQLFRQKKWQGNVTKIKCRHLSNEKAKKGQKYNITVTANHDILVLRNGKKEWIEAGNININDKLFIRAHRCHYCEKLTTYNKNFCNNSCLSNYITNKQWANPEHRKLVSKKTSAQLKKEYKNGTRNTNSITKKANKAVKKMVDSGIWSKKTKESHTHLKGINNPACRKEVRKKISESKIGEKNPMHKSRHNDEYWKTNSEMRKQYYKDNPEKHPNYIMAQKGFMSNLEKIMKNALQKEEINIEQQYNINNKWVDFAIVNKKIAIECDGEYWHKDKIKEKKRDKQLEDEGWSILHFTGDEIKNDINKCISEIKRILKNHNNEYEFMPIDIFEIKTWKLKRARTTYNFEVEDHQTYIGNNFIVHNCVLVPITRSWEELGHRGAIPKLAPGQRPFVYRGGKRIPSTIPFKAHKNRWTGQVPATEKYNDWLLRMDVQDPDFVKKILGPDRYGFWKSGKVKLTEMAKGKHILTLSELKAQTTIAPKLGPQPKITITNLDSIEGQEELLQLNQWFEKKWFFTNRKNNVFNDNEITFLQKARVPEIRAMATNFDVGSVQTTELVKLVKLLEASQFHRKNIRRLNVLKTKPPSARSTPRPVTPVQTPGRPRPVTPRPPPEDPKAVSVQMGSLEDARKKALIKVDELNNTSSPIPGLNYDSVVTEKLEELLKGTFSVSTKNDIRKVIKAREVERKAHLDILKHDLDIKLKGKTAREQWAVTEEELKQVNRLKPNLTTEGVSFLQDREIRNITNIQSVTSQKASLDELRQILFYRDQELRSYVKWVQTLDEQQYLVERARLIKSVTNYKGRWKDSDKLIYDRIARDGLEYVPFDLLADMQRNGARLLWNNRAGRGQASAKTNIANLYRKDSSGVLSDESLVSHEWAHLIDGFWSKKLERYGFQWSDNKYVKETTGKGITGWFNGHKTGGTGILEAGDGRYWKNAWLIDYEARIYVYRQMADGTEWLPVNIGRLNRHILDMKKGSAFDEYLLAKVRYPKLTTWMEETFGQRYMVLKPVGKVKQVIKKTNFMSAEDLHSKRISDLVVITPENKSVIAINNNWWEVAKARNLLARAINNKIVPEITGNELLVKANRKVAQWAKVVKDNYFQGKVLSNNDFLIFNNVTGLRREGIGLLKLQDKRLFEPKKMLEMLTTTDREIMMQGRREIKRIQNEFEGFGKYKQTFTAKFNELNKLKSLDEKNLGLWIERFDTVLDDGFALQSDGTKFAMSEFIKESAKNKAFLSESAIKQFNKDITDMREMSQKLFKKTDGETVAKYVAKKTQQRANATIKTLDPTLMDDFVKFKETVGKGFDPLGALLKGDDDFVKDLLK